MVKLPVLAALCCGKARERRDMAGGSRGSGWELSEMNGASALVLHPLVSSVREERLRAAGDEWHNFGVASS